MLSVALLLLAAGSSVKCETLTQSASVTVQPGQRLTISCQVSYSVSDYWTGWIRQPAGKGLEWIGSKYTGKTSYKDSLRSQFSITLVASSKTATLSGQNMQPGDTAVYYCARYTGSGALDYWGKGTMVTVSTATPRAPSAFPLTSCGSGTGDMVTLGCLATGFSPSTVTYTWRKDGVDITDFIQYPPVLKDNFYTGVSQLRVRRQDWTANPKPCYTCVATNTAGNGQVTICPKSVYCHPATLRVLTSSSEEDEVSFSCFAKDFSPKDHEFKWLKNNEEVSNKIFEVSTPSKEESKTENGTLYSAASFLTVAKSEWSVGDMFTCKFRGSCENNVSTFKTLNFTYNDCTGPFGCKKADAEIKIIQPSNKEMFEQRKGKIVCQVKQNVPSVTRIWWEDEEENELANSDDASSLKSLSLDITFDEWTRGLKRICKVAHSELLAPFEDFYERKAADLPETDVSCDNALDAEEDSMGSTLITFILLFLITLLFTIGTTALKIK